MSESSVLVERFEDLQLGWTVTLRNCKQCGADHKLYVDAYNPRSQGYDAGRYTDPEPVFVGIAVDLINVADPVHSERVGIFARAVEEKRVFRVVDASAAVTLPNA